MVTETNTKLKLLSTLDNVSRWVAPNNRLNSLNLDLNENCLGKTDDFFLNQLRNFDPYVISRYPEYDNILKDLQTYTGVSKDQILLTNGADQGIELICRLFFRPGARVLVPSPVFSYYYHVLNLLGSSIIPIHYHKQKCNFIFPLLNLLNNIPNSDGVILCNPNNPLGISISLDDLEQVIYKCNSHKVPCIIDEAYFEFHGQTAVPFMKNFKNILIIRSFSKFFCLAGLRLGYIIADSEYIDKLLKIRGPWDINHFSVFAGSKCLENINYFTEKKKLIDESKSAISCLLDLNATPYYPSQTNFISIHDLNGTIKGKLNKNNINVNDISKYPYSNDMLKEHVRLTIPNIEDLLILMNALRINKNEIINIAAI